MDSLPPERLTGPTNELAKERNRAAAERTLMSWIQNCLTLIGFGIAFDQISQALRVRSQTHANVILDESFTPILALGFIIFGIVLLTIALFQYRLAVTSIEHENYTLMPVSQLNRIVVVAILLFGFMASIAIFLSL